MSEPVQADREDDGRGRYRCAVVVFVDTRGCDFQDAAAGAAMTIRTALTGDLRTRLPVTLTSPLAANERFAGHDMTARVVGVMDLGTAAGNGYLWTEPTARAWLDYGHDRPDIMRQTWAVPEGADR